jgi:glutamate formiminotransferase / formiminotetrahydrofolate cyclodeaminase
MNPILECVPNFSEGIDLEKIGRIAEAIGGTEGVKLLNVDPGKAANRTVITFAGSPLQVCESAFNAVKIASEIIDMRKHKGEHPRFGSTDVLPLVPVSGISMEETIHLARNLAKRIGEELHIPIYCYEYAAFEEKRKNLANCRSGEYEGLPLKMENQAWKPDFGPGVFDNRVAQTGAIALGARKFLIAYNINLNTKSAEIANAIASEVREKGIIQKDADGNILKGSDGKSIYKPGLLKCVKGMGWYLKDYDIAQLSYNLTDIDVNSVHQVFDVSCKISAKYGVKVTGSELIGLIPLKAMLDAGKHYLLEKGKGIAVSEPVLLETAVKELGLSDLAPFDYKSRIVEYLL